MIRLRLLAGFLCVLALAGGPVLAELRPAPPASPEVAPRVIPRGPLRLDCWQEGAKILERRALRDLGVSSERATDWLSFGQDEATIVITALGPTTTCIIGPDRSGP